MFVYTLNVFHEDYVECYLLGHEVEYSHEDYVRMVNEAVLENENSGEVVLDGVVEYLKGKCGFCEVETIDYGVGAWKVYDKIREYDEDIHDSGDWFDDTIIQKHM